MMQIFYAPDIGGKSYTLDEKESAHIIRVLRMKEGESVRIIDGRGNLYEGIITDPDVRRCTIGITGITSNFEKRSYRLHIAISPLKNRERFEWFIEKCVEIGIDEITPVLCHNTEKTGFRADRINSLVISAMKQSLKACKPIINPVTPLMEMLDGDTVGSCMIAHCNLSFPRELISNVYMKNEAATILIGPEGDFNANEIAHAIDMGYSPVHLGSSRLRAETAGIAACHSIYFINQ